MAQIRKNKDGIYEIRSGLDPQNRKDPLPSDQTLPQGNLVQRIRAPLDHVDANKCVGTSGREVDSLDSPNDEFESPIPSEHLALNQNYSRF